MSRPVPRLLSLKREDLQLHLQSQLALNLIQKIRQLKYTYQQD